MELQQVKTHLRDAIEMVQHAAEYASEGLDSKDYIKHRFSDYGFTESGNTSYKVWMNIAAKVLLDNAQLTNDEQITQYFRTNVIADKESLRSYFDKFMAAVIDHIKFKNPALAEELGYS